MAAEPGSKIAVNQGRANRAWGGLLIAFGGLFLVVGALLFARELLFGREAIAAHGTVVELLTTDSGDGPNVTPVIEFRTRTGEAVRFQGMSTKPHAELGEPVPVLYRPANPRDARINSFAQRWLMPTIFCPFGTVALLAGVYRVRPSQVKAVA